MRIPAVVSVVLLAGCASDPIIDRKGVDERAYQQDLAECRAYAAEVDTTSETIKGGAVGAAVLGTVGAIFGDSNRAERGAGAGAVLGGSRGMTEAEERKERILYRCMKGRGYRVLG